MKKILFFLSLFSIVVINTLLFQNCTEFTAINLSSENPNLSENFQERALEVLSNNCRSCHINQSLGDVSNILDVSHLLSSQLIRAGEPDNSPLYLAVNNDSMPPGAPVSNESKRILRSWILNLQAGPVTPIEPDDLTFTYRVNLEPMLFKTRLAKLVSFVGSSTHSSLDKVKADRIFLGDYDFANAILPKVSWEATDMKAWIEAIEPICAANDVKTRFSWPNNTNNFVQTALGRAPSALENTFIQELNNRSIPNAEKFEVLCITTLGSLEYTSK